MRRLALLSVLALAACGEPSAVKITPTDRFALPASVALTARQGGGSALLVASGNYDLTYDGATGGTVLSVDPALAADGGSARSGGGALVRYGAGAHVGSFAGELAVADQATCPVLDANGVQVPGQAPVALLTTRFADQVWRLPVGLDGAVEPCSGAACTATIDRNLHDPFNLTLACRGHRRSAFVGYMRTASLNGITEEGWLAEVDLDAPSAPARTIPVGIAPLAGMAHDAQTDRLYVLTQQLLAARVYVLDLPPCSASAADCPPPPNDKFVDLWFSVPGLDPQSIALSNPQPGLGRRAYLSARVYDASLAALIGVRPSGDLDAVLLVLDLEEDLTGRPSLKVLQIVAGLGLGPSQVRVLPVRAPVAGAPRRDAVVVSSTVEGVVTIYDDETGEVRFIPIDSETGAPEAGRAGFGLAVEKLAGVTPEVARVYVAASQQDVVGLIDVPLDAPATAKVLRDAGGTLIRIGGLK